MKKWLSNILVKYLVKKSVVVSNQKIGDSFQLLTIKLARPKEWIPGQKIQIKVTPDELRSYTPTKWGKDLRTFDTLIYNHGNGPGAIWSEKVKPLSTIQVVGPRNSLDIRDIKTGIFFFGDETTFGLAYALKQSSFSHEIHCFFEGSSEKDSLKALGLLELNDAAFFERTPSNEHLKLCLEKILLDYKDQVIILSGKKDSLEFMFESLIQKGIPAEKMIKKRYWGWKKGNQLSSL